MKKIARLQNKSLNALLTTVMLIFLVPDATLSSLEEIQMVQVKEVAQDQNKDILPLSLEAPPSVILEKKHVIDKEKYSIEFPGGWEITEGMMGTDIVALAPLMDPEDLFRENVNIISARLNNPITTEQYYIYNLKSLEKFLTDFDLEKTEDVKIDGVEAKKLVFSHTMGVVNTEVIQYLFLKGQDAYALTCTSDQLHYKEINPIFDQIVTSFKFK